jgi:predicted ArsR family transcriptional regulator
MAEYNELRKTTVIRALNSARKPLSAVELAVELKATENEVLRILRGLKRDRIVKEGRNARNGGVRTWRVWA